MTDSPLSPESSILTPIPPAPPPARRVDTHSHLLPGVDDGCKTIDESIACAQVLVANGYSHAFCTPHIWHNNRGISRTSVPRLVKALQLELDAAQVPLTLFPGGEMNLYLGVDKTPPEEVVPLGMGTYMLVDMWFAELPPFFEGAVEWLQNLGLSVVLAHPERMRAVQDDPALIDYIQSLGVYLQGNLQCFNDRPGAATRTCAEKFLLDGKYFTLGSDTHNPETINARMAGLSRVRELVGEATLDQLTIENPRKLVPEGFETADERR
jgi:protein-tyrosine phosphatase